MLFLADLPRIARAADRHDPVASGRRIVAPAVADDRMELHARIPRRREDRPEQGRMLPQKRMLWAGSSKSLRDSWYAASPDTEFFLHEFPAAENIPLDFIDPLQPDARTGKINTLLVEWLTR